MIQEITNDLFAIKSKTSMEQILKEIMTGSNFPSNPCQMQSRRMESKITGGRL